MKSFKAVIVGDSFVGKTALASAFSQGNFSETYIPTIGGNIFTKELHLPTITANLNILDSGGQEAFRQLNATYFKGASGAIICYAINDRSSFDNLSYWISELQSYLPNAPVVLVATKLDIEDERVVTEEEGINVAVSNNFQFFETSAKTGYNVKKVFHALTKLILSNK